MEWLKLYNGLKIPTIGYGTFPLKEELHRALPYAIKKGYQMIDTSDNYDNEAYVGEALKQLSYDELDNIIIVSKFSQPLRSQELYKCFQESVSLIDGNHGIDIYLLHWPYPYLWKEQWKRMEELYLKGKCKAIGVCNFEKDKMEELLRICSIKPMINQLECHPYFNQSETVEYCRQNKIIIMSYSPLARMDKELMSDRVICKLAEKYNKLPTQIILRWNIDNGFVPIPASSDETHIAQNIDVLDFKLDFDEIQEINNLEKGKRIRFDPKTRFNKGKIRQFYFYSIKMKLTGKFFRK